MYSSCPFKVKDAEKIVKVNTLSDICRKTIFACCFSVKLGDI